MGWVAAGGLVMALALVGFAVSVAGSLIGGRASTASTRWDGMRAPQAGAAALVGPLAVLVIVIGMYGATALGFEMMRALPVEAVGAGHAH